MDMTVTVIMKPKTSLNTYMLIIMMAKIKIKFMMTMIVLVLPPHKVVWETEI